MNRRDGSTWHLAGILCPSCGTNSSKVIDSREKPGVVRRRRECIRCGGRWTTEEKALGFKHGRRPRRDA